MALQVYTVLTGRSYGPHYAERLQRMLARHLSAPHSFMVLCDAANRAALESLGIQHRPLEPRGLQGFCSKIQLFNAAITGEAPFLFFDVTLVVRANLDPLLRFAAANPAAVIGVRDWNYPTLNSCVMQLRPGAATARVWQAYLEGEDHGTPGPNQNFIHRVLQRHCPGALATWPEGLVASYRGLRKLARRDGAAAERARQAACVLKFHGRPRPHEVLRPWRHPSQTLLKHPLRPALWNHLAGEITEHWLLS